MTCAEDTSGLPLVLQGQSELLWKLVRSIFHAHAGAVPVYKRKLCRQTSGSQDDPEGFGSKTLGNSFATTRPISSLPRLILLIYAVNLCTAKDMVAAQVRAYNSSRYQTPSLQKAAPLEHHAQDGRARGCIASTTKVPLYRDFDASSQQRQIRDILLRGLRQDLCHILACLAEALTTTGHCSDQHAPTYTR